MSWVSTAVDRDARRRRWRRLASASRVKVGGGDGLSSACKYFTLHSSQFSFRLGVSQSHNFASTPPEVGHSLPRPLRLRLLARTSFSEHLARAQSALALTISFVSHSVPIHGAFSARMHAPCEWRPPDFKFLGNRCKRDALSNIFSLSLVLHY